MEPNNRQSIRIRAAVPGRFLAYARQPTLEQLHQAFGLSDAYIRNQAIADLDTELNAALGQIRDTATRATLHLLQQRMDLLSAPPVPEQLPEPLDMTLSAEGIGIQSPDEIPVGYWLGVYLLLDGLHPFLACARIIWCEASAGGPFRCGAKFSDMPADQARRLTKFVMKRSRVIHAA